MKKLAKILAFVIAAVAVLPFMKGLPVHAAGDIKIDKSHFPDDNFRSVIRTAAYDSDLNGYLSLSERNNVINIHCESSNIYSVEGIKYFPNVEGLWCLDNHISSWDLSQNTHLKGIWCSQNDFTTLDFSNNKELEWLYCFKCSKLTSLNVSENTELAYLECNANPKLTSLNLKNNKKLENLFCSDCNLKSLNLSGNKLLCELDAFNNKLTYINLSNNTKLKRLDVWNNPNLGNVNVSKLKELEFYNCAETGATKVDVTNNPELQMLVCSYNEDLTSLDLSHNPRLAVLHLDCDWKLTSLDLSHNPKLYYLQAFGLRGISKLDISNNSRLIKAYKEGVYQDEPKLGEVHSYTINYGGSGEYFDNLLHCLVVDNDVTIVTTGSTSSNVNDSFIDTNDGHSNSESFATREEAVMLLYQKAGSPAVRGNSTFKDVSSSASYAKAVKWAQDNNICFGYPDICSDTFGVGKQISRQDFALMAHRFAGYMKLGTSFD
ncbi:MAG: S-layer homology domain-containing protein, partial [Oscillospiraceae bacterium]|nr:S-layer homology domain-containing protein [Oscillospiraceae bacterium]